AMGELERMEGVLLDQEYGQALAGIELADDLEDLLHDQGSEAERWLIEQEQAGPRHQRAGDRQHLLLAARERAAALGLALVENGEDLEGAGEILLEIPGIGAGRTHLQVFEHRHAREDAAAFRRLRDAEADDLMRRALGDVVAGELDRSGPAARRSANGHHQRRLAGAVGPNQGDDLALIDVDIDALEGLNLAIEGLDATHGKKGLRH